MFINSKYFSQFLKKKATVFTLTYMALSELQSNTPIFFCPLNEHTEEVRPMIIPHKFIQPVEISLLELNHGTITNDNLHI